MKRWICLALALILCAALVAPAFASENVFVPSVTYKETPPVVNATIVIPPEIFDLADVPEELVEKIENTEEDFGQVDGCIVVTSILQADGLRRTDHRRRGAAGGADQRDPGYGALR